MNSPWNDARSYEDSECTEDMTGGRVAAFVDFVASTQFMVGVFVGAWFTIGAAFVVAFA